MRRDPMEVLARLRAIGRDTARREMAAAQARLAAAEDARRAAAEALLAEAEDAAPVDYAAWLPAAFRARIRAGEGQRRAAAEAEAARAALVLARADAEAVESLLDVRRAEARRERLRAEQAVLDDVRR